MRRVDWLFLIISRRIDRSSDRKLHRRRSKRLSRFARALAVHYAVEIRKRGDVDKEASFREIKAEDERGLTPLLSIWSAGFDPRHFASSIQTTKLLFYNGASPKKAITVLHMAIRANSCSVVEFLLRSGCTSNCVESKGPSPLSIAIFESYSTRIIERLLAFGVDLEKEPDLQQTRFESALQRYHKDDVELIGLKALRELHRSGKMISLKKLCRGAIRRYLEPNADDIIQKLTDLPSDVKSYLLVEREAPYLDL